MVWAGRKVPTGDAPGFNAEDPYADPVALLEHREYVVWEKEVKIEEAKLVDKYLDSIKGVGVYRANVDRYAENPPQVKGE